MKKEISDNWTTSTHGGTFTGNLVSCAAGRATIKILKAELPKMAKKIKLFEKLVDELIKKYPLVYKYRQGVGFMIGLQCKDKVTNTELRKLALAKGLLLINSGPEADVIRFAPPLTISLQDLRKGLTILADVSAELNR
jgi:4-aminobutyrate aminotransferase